MANNKKNSDFVGKAKQIGNKIQISFEWETLKKMQKVEFEGKKYLVLDVIPLKEKGRFGHTHTIVDHTPMEKRTEKAEAN